MALPSELVREHWKEFHPTRYQKYLAEGILERESLIIQAKVADMITALTDEEIGMSWEEARHTAFAELIFTDPEESVKKTLMEWDDEED